MFHKFTGHLGLPHERTRGQQDGSGRGQPEFPADVLHQRQRFRADRIRPCRRTDPFPDGLTEVPLCFIFLPG